MNRDTFFSILHSLQEVETEIMLELEKIVDSNRLGAMTHCLNELTQLKAIFGKYYAKFGDDISESEG